MAPDGLVTPTNDRFTDAVDKASVSDRARVPFEAGILVDKRVHASQ
jgi:hypothetical protein